MKKIIIYTKGYCPFCKKAVQLIENSGADFEEIDVANDEKTYNELKERTGHQTVPQVFIGDEFIGGFDDLNALKSSGELETKLSK